METLELRRFKKSRSETVQLWPRFSGCLKKSIFAHEISNEALEGGGTDGRLGSAPVPFLKEPGRTRGRSSDGINNTEKRETVMGLFTSEIKSMDDLFLHALQDIYYAENQIVKIFPT